MASGTIYGNTSNEYIDSKIEWSSYGNDVDTNKSVVRAKLYYRRNNTGYTTSGTGSFGIKIGESNITVSKTLTISTDWVLALDSGGVGVNHEPDGTKIITISASGSIPGTSLTSTNCSSTVALDTIPRASIITNAPDRYLGTECVISWIPASSSFRYKIRFSLKNWNYITGIIHPNKTSAYTYTGYTLPKAVADQFTDSYLYPMTATLYTYSDSNATKQVGSESSVNFNVAMADTPVVNCYLSPESLIEHPFGGIYVQGVTRLKVDLSRSIMQYGASVKSVSVTLEGKTYEANTISQPITTDCITTSGSVSVRCQVTDSRGNVGNGLETIIVHPYSKPKIVKNTGENSIICHRCYEGGDLNSKGTFLRIKATRQYSAMDGRNTSTLKYEIRAVGSNSLYDSGTLLGADRTTPNVVDDILNVNLDTTTSYTVTLTLKDDMGYEDTFTEIVSTDLVTMHLRDGGRGIGFGKYCETDNAVEIADDWVLDVRGAVHAHHIGQIDTYANKDFNELKYRTGYYSDTSAPGNISATNYPVNETGVLEVISVMWKNSMEWVGFAYQTYRTYTGNIWTRSYYEQTGWTAWKKVTLT